ncbi:MAG: AzlD domain-containing protein [Mogibacterium sp.]|nr:AzlD domain-containing protein [Mogibacterium sp.]
MSNIETLILIAVLSLTVIITRGLPFMVFSRKNELPHIVKYLGSVLPSAMTGLLIVYCFKDYNWHEMTEIVPAIIAAASVCGIHLWKKNMILSIFTGTLIYMVLLRIM